MKKVFLGFKIYYLLYVLAAFTALVNGYSWMNIATIILTVFGAVVVLCLFVHIIRNHLRITNLILIVAFLCSYVLSSLMTAKYGITDNIKEMFWLAFPMLILYASSWCYSTDEIQKELKVLSVIYVIYATIAGAISLSMLQWGHNYNVAFSKNDVRVIGFKWGRLWGVFDDPNHGATMLVVGIILAVYLILISKNKAVKILCGLTIPVQYMYIVFSDSRTGEVALSAAILVGMSCWVYQNQRIKEKREVGKIVLTVIVSCFLVMGNFLISYEVKDSYNKYEHKKWIEQQANNRKNSSDKDSTNKKSSDKNSTIKNKPDSNSRDIAEIGRKNDIENDVSNGRLSIWKSGLELVKTSPVYGTSFRNITKYAEDNAPNTYIINTEYGGYYDSFHNTLMDVLVSQGLIGILIVATILVNTVVYLKGNWKFDQKRFKIQAACLAIMFALGISSMFLSMIFYLNSPQTYIFWLVFGYFLILVSGTEKK